MAPALCPNCGNHVVFHLLEVRNWLRLFFVPLVPGRARHVVYCPVCQYGIDLTAEQTEAARTLIALTAGQRSGSVDPAVYRRTVDEFWSMLGGERLLDVRDARPGPPPSDHGEFDAPAPDPGTATSGPAAGWYGDPFGESQQRYWDGERWTAGTNPPVFKG